MYGWVFQKAEIARAWPVGDRNRYYMSRSRWEKSSDQIPLLYLPTQMRSDWTRVCHVSGVKLTNSQGEQSSLTSTETTTFDSHLGGSCFMKPAISEPVGVKQTISSHCFSIFELGSIKKHLITRPAGNHGFFSPLGQSFNFYCSLITPQ